MTRERGELGPQSADFLSSETGFEVKRCHLAETQLLLLTPGNESFEIEDLALLGHQELLTETGKGKHVALLPVSEGSSQTGSRFRVVLEIDGGVEVGDLNFVEDLLLLNILSLDVGSLGYARTPEDDHVAPLLAHPALIGLIPLP